MSQSVIEHMRYLIGLALPQARPTAPSLTAAVDPRLLIRQVNLLISQLPFISEGRFTIRQIVTCGLQYSSAIIMMIIIIIIIILIVILIIIIIIIIAGF